MVMFLVTLVVDFLKRGNVGAQCRTKRKGFNSY